MNVASIFSLCTDAWASAAGRLLPAISNKVQRWQANCSNKLLTKDHRRMGEKAWQSVAASRLSLITQRT